jgi:hypothetical protein
VHFRQNTTQAASTDFANRTILNPSLSIQNIIDHSAT